MIRMIAFVAATLFAVLPAEVSQASVDRARLPASEAGYVIYFSTSHLEGEQRAKCEAAMAFTVASASRQQIVERCTPERIGDTLYRLDLRDAGWDWRQWFHVAKGYPYYGGKAYVYRADWLVVQLGDTTQSDAYYRLLYGRDKVDLADFLKVWGVNNDATYHFGVVTQSKHPLGPAVAGVRLVENRPTNTRGSAWGTRDSAVIDGKSDPLQHLDNSFKHDASEWLVAMPKQSLTTGERGALMAYFLADGKGNRQEEAPPAIVTDHLGFRGQHAIRNVGSCVGCHATGYLPPGVSELRSYIAKGVDVYATPKALQEQIERFHLSDSAKQLARDNEDFIAGVRMTSGLDGEANAEAFRATFAYYDADLSLAVAASELHATPDDLRLALAYASNGGVKLGVRLAGLPHEGTISRRTWEQFGYLTAYYALQDWNR
jgi:hypothetical protein